MIKPIRLRRFFDDRGYLVENSAPEVLGNVRHFLYTVSKPGVVRGNHYHEKKVEWFCILKGECRFVTEDINTKERN